MATEKENLTKSVVKEQPTTKKENLTKSVVKEYLVLRNPNRYAVPVMLKRCGKLIQENIAPRSFINILPSEITDCVVNLTNDKTLLLKKS